MACYNSRELRHIVNSAILVPVAVALIGCSFPNTLSPIITPTVIVAPEISSKSVQSKVNELAMAFNQKGLWAKIILDSSTPGLHNKNQLLFYK